MRIQRVLFLLPLLYICAFNVHAGTFYVDRNHPVASDTNAGGEAFPWKSIVHAAEVARAGDTVLIKAGIYQDGDVTVANSGAPGREIIFADYQGHERQAVIRDLDRTRYRTQYPARIPTIAVR